MVALLPTLNHRVSPVGMGIAYGEASHERTCWGATSLEHSGPEQTRGPGRRRGTTARERNRLSEQKLARSAHLPQKLATTGGFRTSRAKSGTPHHGWNPASPIFFGVAKSYTCFVSIQLFRGGEGGEDGLTQRPKKIFAAGFTTEAQRARRRIPTGSTGSTGCANAGR
jgi:hypothetical protein